MIYSLYFSLPACTDVAAELRLFGKAIEDKDAKQHIDLHHFLGIAYKYRTDKDLITSDLDGIDCSGGFFGAKFNSGRLNGVAFLSTIVWCEEIFSRYGGEYYGIFDLETVVFKNTKEKLYISKEIVRFLPNNLSALLLSEKIEWCDRIEI